MREHHYALLRGFFHGASDQPGEGTDDVFLHSVALVRGSRAIGRRLGDLEPVPRGRYCGSLFRLGPDGSFDSNIIIRSLMLKDRVLRAHAGCGIVADSDPAAEAAELGWKLDPLLRALA